MTALARLLAAGASVALLGGCAKLFPPSEPSPTETRLEQGVEALDRGDLEAAEAAFREVASSCEAGQDGRDALLLLSTLALEPRNPSADPDRAARLAAAYLRLPDASDVDVSLAKTLYLLALDRGASALASDSASPQEDALVGGVAGRFSNCGGGGVVERIRVLPTHPGPRAVDRLEQATSERDSLQLRADSLSRTLQAARVRIRELEAELERIRKLLKGGSGRPDPGAP